MKGRNFSRETLYDYKGYAKEVFMIYSVRRYDMNGQKLLTTNEKYFIKSKD